MHRVGKGEPMHVPDFRSIIVAVLTITLVVSGSPGLLAIAAAPRAAATGKAIRATAELFDASGQRILRIDGSDVGDRAAFVAKALRTNPTVLDDWREAAIRYATRSKRGMAGIKTTMQIINAFAAPTDAAYHEQIRQLPVTIVKSPGRDRDTVQTSYYVRGVVRLRVSTVTAVAADDPADAERMTQEESDAEAAAETSLAAPETAAVTDAQEEECYVDGQVVPCATEQERQDALVAAIAMEDEAVAVDAEGSAQIAQIEEYCWQNPGVCDEPEPDDPIVGGPSAREKTTFWACNSEKWNFVAAAAATHAAGFTLVGLLLAPAAVPALVVVGGVLAIGSGLAWMYSGGVSLNDCARRLVAM